MSANAMYANAMYAEHAATTTQAQRVLQPLQLCCEQTHGH
jgi:hypothetical protein